MLLADVVETSRRIAEPARRLEKTDLLAGLLRRLDPEEIEVAVAFLSGTTRQGRLGIGYAMLRDAASSPAETPSLQLREVDRTFESVTAAGGPGSIQLKVHLLASLLGRAPQAEQQFLTRLLLGELRQGALEGLMVDAVARAAGLAAALVRRAVMFTGAIGAVARAALTEGESCLSRFSIQLFRPVQPMLAQSADAVVDALGELGEAALEFKLDGARVQVHKAGDEIRVYSRRLNDVTAAVPEVVEAVRAIPARQLILDGEVIAMRPNGRPQPFQVTMRRFGRKLDVDRMRASLPLMPFWFDLLHLDQGDLIDESQARRFAALAAVAPPEFLMPHVVTASPDEAGEFLESALRQGHEGIMAKATGAPYEAGSRGQSWLKIKPARTLDLVVLAAEWGHGRRQGWLSNLHLGARDTEKGGFAMLGKTFRGLTDEVLAWQTQELLKLEIGRDQYTVYVEPKLVVEIAFNEIQVSPRYPRGLALRFARVKRYRTDKTAAEADTFETVQALAGSAK